MRLMRIIAGVAVFGALAGAAHADEPGLTATEIRIGEILPLTGPVSFAGEAHYLGTKVALAEANASGGAAGRKIVAVTEDERRLCPGPVIPGSTEVACGRGVRHHRYIRNQPSECHAADVRRAEGADARYDQSGRAGI